MAMNPFDIGQYREVLRPCNEASSMPSHCYVSPEWYAAEVEHIFMYGWHLVGRADQIPDPGDYFSFEIAEERVLLVRGEDDHVRAFSPACRHRGSLVAQGDGNCRAFVCPYHRWTYSTEGALRSAPAMEQAVSFDAAEYGLVEFRLEQWAGFLFVTLDSDARSLEAELGDLPELMARYRLDEMVFTRQKTYDLACNWKCYVDNSTEAYHVPSVHGKSLEPVAPMQVWQYAVRERYYNIYAYFPGTMGVLKGERSFPPIEGLGEQEVERHDLAILLPNTVITATVDSLWWVTASPRGPNRTFVMVNHAFPRKTVERADFAEIAQGYYDRFDMVNVEDNDICELQQIGITQRARRPGRYSDHEELVGAFAAYVTEQVLEQRT